MNEKIKNFLLSSLEEKENRNNFVAETIHLSLFGGTEAWGLIPCFLWIGPQKVVKMVQETPLLSSDYPENLEIAARKAMVDALIYMNESWLVHFPGKDFIAEDFFKIFFDIKGFKYNPNALG